MIPTSTALPARAQYFPLQTGRYEVKVGLYTLDTDFGNGNADSRAFQIDTDWHFYRAQKLQSRREQLDKYACARGFGEPAQRAVIALLLERLPREYPEYFELSQDPRGACLLRCALSAERLHFKDLRYVKTEALNNAARSLEPVYQSALDALACQVQEDLAVVELEPDGGDRLSALHLCFPNHWSPRDKIGRSFAEMHDPVPGIDRISRNAGRLVQRLTQRGPYVRFAWGLSTDRRLNHHPLPPADYADGSAWQGRDFKLDAPQLYLRIERQVLLGMPEASVLLFTIRTYFRDVKALSRDERVQLADAIQSTSEHALRYKGLAEQREAIQSWLAQLRQLPANNVPILLVFLSIFCVAPTVT